MTVASIAEWTAIEDEILLITKFRFAVAPAAALNEVTTCCEARTGFGGFVTENAGSRGVKKILTIEELCCQLQQLRVVACVSIRKRRNETVRTLHVQQKLTRPLETFVIRRAELQSEAPGVLTRAKKGT